MARHGAPPGAFGALRGAAAPGQRRLRRRGARQAAPRRPAPGGQEVLREGRRLEGAEEGLEEAIEL